MRKLFLSGIVMGLALSLSGRASASEGFDELSKLAKAGVGEEVMLAYVSASPIAFDLSVDEILFFNDLGVSSKVIAAVVKHGKDLRSAGLVAQAQAPAPLAPATSVVGDEPEIGQPAPAIQAPIEKPFLQPDDPTLISQPAPEPVITTTTVLAAEPDRANISYFYEALSPYGQWIDSDGQWVWQPSAVTTDVGWRPYCQRGHWVYTDAGWAWQSDYSWGWAAFHYGRWESHARYGWVWHPDTVWGPAWVSWRNSETHCGWAPLPPAARFETGVGFHFGGKHGAVDFSFGLRERDYTFVPVERVTETTITTYVVPREQVVTVYRQTAVVDNAVVYRDDRVVNVGISIDLVQRHTHREIRPVTIVDLNVRAGEPIRGNRLTDASFAVYRPQIRDEAPVDPRVAEARREEAVQREIVRQQELTARNTIRQQNLTQQVQANQAARTQETIARKQAETERVQANQAASAAAAKARADAATAAAQTHEIEREQRLTAEQQRQLDAQKAAEKRRETTIATEQANRAAAEQKRAADQAAAAQRQQAELAAEAERKKELEQKREASAAAAAQRQQAEQAAAAERQKEAAQKRAADQAAATAREAEREKAAEAKRQQTAGAAAERAREAQAKRDADAAARAAAAQQAAQQAPQQPPPPDDPKDNKKKRTGGGSGAGATQTQGN